MNSRTYAEVWAITKIDGISILDEDCYAATARKVASSCLDLRRRRHKLPSIGVQTNNCVSTCICPLLRLHPTVRHVSYRHSMALAQRSVRHYEET